MIEQAGLKPWPKLLQNLRATRETELLGKYPAKDVTSWFGNSPTIAHKHYAMVTDEAFAKAIVETTISAPHRTPQTVQEQARREATAEAEAIEEGEIDTAKDVISLDLSCLDDHAPMQQSCPTRTRT